MPMIIINTQDIECTVRQELVKVIDEVYGASRVDLPPLADKLIEAIIECGDETPVHNAVEAVCHVLNGWDILTNRPNQLGRLAGELVRAALGITPRITPRKSDDASHALRIWREWYEANVKVAENDSSLPEVEPVSAGECPTDET